MLFNSLIFLAFAIVFFALWPIANRKNQSRWIYITLASFLFYGWWDWRFLFLIVGSGLLDYISALQMAKKPGSKRFWLILSLLGNIGSLAVFKYSGFIAESIDTMMAAMGTETHMLDKLPEFTLILPVGISFYTFQSMSYSIDVYKGKLEPTKQIFHFFSYLAMFPQLVAGPIIRARHLLNQLATRRIPSAAMKWHGTKLVVYGLFQKTVIADNLGPMVDYAFSGENVVFDSSAYWWMVMIAFGLQIYFDFSGYSLMARGFAKWMGLHFRMNFNHPYVAASLREFWMRWHISLSTWFRDYVYIPLGGNKKGVAMGLVFMSITMVVSGLWHGPFFTMILWGALHAAYLIFERITKWPRILAKFPFGRVVAVAFVLLQVLVAWVFFRSKTMDEATGIIATMFEFNMNWDFMEYYFDQKAYIWLAVILEGFHLLKVSNLKVRQLADNRYLDALGLAIALVACVFLRGPEAKFIYFQF